MSGSAAGASLSLLPANSARRTKKFDSTSTLSNLSITPTGELDIAVTEPNSRYELAQIDDSRTASVETKVAAFIAGFRELSIRRLVKTQTDAKRQVIVEAKAADERRQAEIRKKSLEHLKQVEESGQPNLSGQTA
jgi:hypothetical protein